MKFETKTVRRYSCEVVEHVKMDQLRKEHCLCLNCKHCNCGCNISNELYELCIKNNMALAVTRCKEFEIKGIDK